MEGTGNLIFKSGFDDHLIKAQGIVRKGNKGVVGGHNLDSFNDILRKQGWNVDELIISKTPHPSIDGVFEIKYKIPALDNTGKVIEGQFKNIPYPKTVFDPNKISNETMIQWGKEAMQNGTKNGRIIDGYAENGLKFRGYIDEATGEITNFFPVLE